MSAIRKIAVNIAIKFLIIFIIYLAFKISKWGSQFMVSKKLSNTFLLPTFETLFPHVQIPSIHTSYKRQGKI